MRWLDVEGGIAGALCGAVYGVGLFVFAIPPTGYGHGTYLPFAVFGAPLSLVHERLALFGVLILWPVGGFVLGASRRAIWPVLFLLVHALAVGAVLLWGSPFESGDRQWEYFEKAKRQFGGAITSGLIVYLTGQVAAWALVLFRIVRRGDRG
jgi:hypothetical protein